MKPNKGSAKPSERGDMQAPDGEAHDDAKQWYRSSSDGELGWMVERGGQKYIQLNRPNEEILRPWSGGAHWVPEVEHRPINRAQLAKVCFEADRSLCQALGIYEPAKKEWASLTDKERIMWMEKGPKGPERSAVWIALNHVLEPLTR